MKSHMLISMHYLELGGAETALIGLLQALDPKRVDVDLFLYDHRGEMMKFVPEWVHLLPQIPEYSVLEHPIKELVQRRYWGIAIARLLAKSIGSIIYRKSGRKLLNMVSGHYISQFALPFLPQINKGKTYDLAISFLTPHQYVLHKVSAGKKVAWIHTDYTRVTIDARRELTVWGKYDFIASISDDVTKTFLQVFPSLESKIIKIENILSPMFVRRRAEEFKANWKLPDNKKKEETTTALIENNELKLLTIGRFSEPKNFDNLPFICKSVLGEVKNLRWYIIGYGPDEQLIRKEIEEAGMQEYVIILGKKENPYPYIKACDIYVQPSRYEGNSVTVREAQMLCKPVVVTNYPTAGSQVKDGDDGVIVPMDNEGCAKGIVELIMDTAKQKHIIEYLKTHDYGNEREVEKIYQLLGI